MIDKSTFKNTVDESSSLESVFDCSPLFVLFNETRTNCTRRPNSCLTFDFLYFFISKFPPFDGDGFLPSRIFTTVYSNDPPRTTNIPVTPITVAGFFQM